MRPLIAVATVLLLATACGDSNVLDTVGAGAPATTAAATTAPPTTTAPATTSAPTVPPTTAAPVTTVAGIVPGADPDVDAIVAAFQVAFDSTSTFEDKAVFIDDPSGLESTIARYIETGESFGGIEVIVSSVVVNGDQADVLYDLLFSGNPTYPDLESQAVRNDAGWQVPRVLFCSVMASARVPCS